MTNGNGKGNGQQIITPPTPMKITQIAVVVRDMEAALKTYTETLGWGPWSVFDYKPPLLHDTRVNGEPVGTDDRRRGVGGRLGFELIQPVSGPSIYQEFLDSHGEGVQHIACMKHSFEESLQVRDHWRPTAPTSDERPDRRLDRVLLPGHRADAQVRARVRQRSRHRPQADLRLPVSCPAAGVAWTGAPVSQADPVRVLVVGDPYMYQHLRQRLQRSRRRRHRDRAADRQQRHGPAADRVRPGAAGVRG
jgi:catechol 2,3-dioxygenase-like lactoylglutathione lyase family enzyme